MLGWRFVNPRMKARLWRRPDGPDRRERRHRAPDQPHRPGRLRLSQPAPLQGRAGSRLLREGDRQGLREEGQDRGRSSRRTSIRAATPRWRRLSKLSAAFRDGGSVTAGNSSGLNDGACAMIIASEAAARANGLTPRASYPGHRVGRRAAARHGHRPGAGDAEAAGQARHDHRATSTRSNSTKRLPPRRWPCCASWASPTTPRT